MKRLEAVKPQNKNEQKKGFNRVKPLLSKMKKPLRVLSMTAGVVVFTSAVAIFGANLGTYFDYVYNTHDYQSMGNRTKLETQKSPQDPMMELALTTAKIPVIGAHPPEKAQLFISLDKESGILTTKYLMVWPTNKGVSKRDEEMIMIYWNYDESANRFVPDRAVTRYHHKNVEFNFSPKDNPVIVIQNPAHTPGIPGPSPRYLEGEPDALDIFTLFSAEKWAGCSLLMDLPQEFSALGVSFTTYLNSN